MRTAPEPPLPPALLAALRQAPRPYLLPPLPADATQAQAAGPEAALAFCLEAARSAHQTGGPAPSGLEPLFTAALARSIADALDPAQGEPPFRAEVLRASDPLVQEHVRLRARAATDRRSVRTTVDAAAHPGKLQGRPDQDPGGWLAGLHRLAAQEDWAGLRDAVQAPPAGIPLPEALEPLRGHEALLRLVRAEALASLPAVQAYEGLRSGMGPAAGSEAAAARGRASQEAGREAEQATVAAFRSLANALQALDPAGAAWVVAQGLRLPRGFPGTGGGKAKEEWDVALLRDAGAAGAEIALLAEVKASPAAAAPDFARLLRGLRRLALAEPGEAYVFASEHGGQRLAGASLRSLAPAGFALPQRVLYACTAAPEVRPPPLAASSRAVLLREPACLAWARARLAGGDPPPALLAPVWQALPGAAHLRATLFQYVTAQAARAAMVRPADLQAALPAP